MTANACPITTLTLNPAVDATYEIARLLADQKSHARAVRYDPGGNGINVGRALKTLGLAAHNFCVTAGEIGQLFQRLAAPQLDHLHAEHIAGETRINVTLQERDTTTQYEVSAVGPTLSAAHLDHLAQHFVERCANGIGVLTGSVPPGVSTEVYGDLAVRIRANGGRAVVDTFGELLRRAVIARPFLIKPNRYELEQFCGQALPTVAAVAQQARALQREGIDYVCVSLGAEGAILCAPDNTYRALAPPVAVNSTVGAGDSMVAGLVAALAQQQSAMDALRLAVACGTGTALHPGTDLFNQADLELLLQKIEIDALDI